MQFMGEKKEYSNRHLFEGQGDYFPVAAHLEEVFSSYTTAIVQKLSTYLFVCSFIHEFSKQ